MSFVANTYNHRPEREEESAQSRYEGVSSEVNGSKLTVQQEHEKRNMWRNENIVSDSNFCTIGNGAAYIRKKISMEQLPILSLFLREPLTSWRTRIGI